MAIDEARHNLQQVDWSKIPPPKDDGAAAHLTGLPLPSISLYASNKRQINIAELKGRTIIYAYPMTGRPDTPLPDGWDQIPGARGRPRTHTTSRKLQTDYTCPIHFYQMINYSCNRR